MGKGEGERGRSFAPDLLLLELFHSLTTLISTPCIVICGGGNADHSEDAEKPLEEEEVGEGARIRLEVEIHRLLRLHHGQLKWLDVAGCSAIS